MEDGVFVDNPPWAVVLCLVGLPWEKSEWDNALFCSSTISTTKEAIFSVSHLGRHIKRDKKTYCMSLGYDIYRFF